MIGYLFSAFFATSIGQRLPRWLWELIAIALLAGGLWLGGHWLIARHDAGIRAEQKAADKKQFDGELASVAAQAIAIRDKAASLGIQISNLNRGILNAQIHDHSAAADALLLHGPGRASAGNCRPIDHSASAAVAGGRNDPASIPDASGSRLPAENGQGVPTGGGDEWAIVPWGWLVQRAREHDDLLSGEMIRRSDDAQQRAAWEKMRAQPPPK